jgi:iron complex transport system substrate-binding protein
VALFTSRRIARAAIWLCASALIMAAAACGSEPRASDTAAGGGKEPAREGTFPVTIEAANGAVTIEAKPERIVSLSATATEMLFAIGAGDQVEAVDDQSNYPAEAPTTDLSGLEVNLEAVAGYEPDLVVYSNDPGGLEESLDELGIPALMEPAAVTLDGTYAQIEQLGESTGHPSEARDLVATMKADIEEISDSLPTFDTPPDYYHELDTNYFTVTSKTFIGEIYSLLGLENIADAADKDKTGYPQLSAEYIIEADPDLVFLADTKCCDQSATSVAKRPGWGQIAAVTNGGVVELDDDVASRWGPRVVDFLRTAAEAVTELEGATT